MRLSKDDCSWWHWKTDGDHRSSQIPAAQQRTHRKKLHHPQLLLHGADDGGGDDGIIIQIQMPIRFKCFHLFIIMKSCHRTRNHHTVLWSTCWCSASSSVAASASSAAAAAAAGSPSCSSTRKFHPKSVSVVIVSVTLRDCVFGIPKHI